MQEEGPDLDLELNAKLMSRVSKPTAYYDRGGVTLAPCTAVFKPNDLIPDVLREDLKLLRKSRITTKAERWKTYGFPELSFALLRGSTAIHIHMMSTVADRY